MSWLEEIYLATWEWPGNTPKILKEWNQRRKLQMARAVGKDQESRVVPLPVFFL